MSDEEVDLKIRKISDQMEGGALSRYLEGRGEKGNKCRGWTEMGGVEAVRVRRIAVIAEPAPANNCPRVTRYVCVSGPVRRVG